MEAQVFLQQTLRVRLDEMKIKNPSFSLRGFAKMLDVSPASLSEFLNGKRNLSAKLINQVAEKLCLNPEEIQDLNEKILRDKKGLTHTSDVDREVIKLKNDQYFMISDWHYYAILSLAESIEFKDDYNWIATKLKTNVKSVKEAMERLMRLGFLNYNAEGKLVPQHIELNTTEDIPNTSIKKRHADNLDAAKESLFTDDVMLRDFSFITMLVDPKRLQEAKKMIRKFQDELVNFLEGGTKTEVYEICMQLFPRTAVNKELVYEKLH